MYDQEDGYREDPLSVARGIVFGVIFGTIIWAALIIGIFIAIK